MGKTKESNNTTTVIAVAAAVLMAVVGVGTAAYALTLDSSENEVAPHSEESTGSHSHKSYNTAAALSAEPSAVIVYKDNGFEQASYTVKSGDTVLVKNESGVDFYFTTGDHHNHDIHSPMNLGVIVPGESSSFIAPKTGIYNFHNHDDKYQAGELIVR